jgi:hypothetical protein
MCGPLRVIGGLDDGGGGDSDRTLNRIEMRLPD